MSGGMHVTFYGVRGSTPCHAAATLRYGGNTSCVVVEVPGEHPIMFDIGTGARYFGQQFPADQPFNGTCLLTHLHWDHVQGLAFFAPLLRPNGAMDIYGPAQSDGRALVEVLHETIGPPRFPVTLADFPGTVRFHELTDDSFSIGGVRVTARLVPHLGPTLGFRVEWNGRSVAYISDHQQPVDGTMSLSDAVLELAAGVDLLIHDAQFTPEEFAAKSTWGHCTVAFAVRLATAARVKTLALFHHDPSRDDAALDAQHAALEASAPGVSILTAREGLRVEL